MSEPRLHSDFGSDRWVFDNLKDKIPPFGYAANVGAGDGIFADGTVWIEDMGWIVLCVEANPLLIDACRSNRKLVRSVACGPEDLEDQTFHSCGAFPHLSTSSLDIHPGYAGHAGITSEHKVSVRRLDRVLEEAGFSKLDYLSIDCEGYEQKVMEGLTLERWKPTVIVIEDFLQEMPPPEHYRLAQRSGWDNIFVRD